MVYLYDACDQISDFCHQHLLRKMRWKISWTEGRTDRGKTVYPPPPSGSGGIIIDDTCISMIHWLKLSNKCLGLVWWCLTPLSTIFQLYCGGQFYWWRKPEYPEKTTEIVTSHWQTLSHNVISRNTSPWTGVRTHNFTVNPTTIRSRKKTAPDTCISMIHWLKLSYKCLDIGWSPTHIM
jgi:hypothetical protein